jgi:phosphoenolpyruvate-protein phosphotransferase (PTS system enzyme I)
MVKTAMEQLDEKRCSYDKNIKIGVMIEVPSLALIADLVAKEVDFASIGSNDLTQYVCASDRMNASVEPYYQTFSPAMLRLLKFIFESFEREGKSVSVCGEMAGSPKGAVILAGLGAKKLSMNYSLLARVKAELSRHTISEIKDLANGCMKLCTEKDIKLQMEK